MKTVAKRFFWMVTCTAALLLIAASQPMQAQDPCAALGSEVVQTDRQGYEPGDTVHITGSGYPPACNYGLEVTAPDGVVTTAALASDEAGNFAWDYPLVNGIRSFYRVAVLQDGNFLAGTGFTDAVSCQLTVDPSLPASATNFLTIQGAVNFLPNPGPCVVTVKAGTYLERVNIQSKNFSATSDAQRIVIKADAPLSVTVNVASALGTSATCGGGPNSQWGFCFGSGTAATLNGYITISGFQVTGATRAGVKFFSSSGSVHSGHDLTLDSNDIRNNNTSSSVDAGVDFGAGATRTWVVNNLIRNNTRFGLGNTSPTDQLYIVNNTFFGNTWGGVSRAASSPVALVNNLIVGNGTTAGGTGNCSCGLGQSSSGTASAITLKNNMFYKNGNLSAGFTDIATPSSVLDATDSGNRTTLGTEGTGVVGCTFYSPTYASACSNTHSFDEIFVSSGTNNFHLKTTTTPLPASPAIDFGVNSYVDGGLEWVPGTSNSRGCPDLCAPQGDFEGTARPLDGNGDSTATTDAGFDEVPAACSAPAAAAGGDQTVCATTATLAGNDPAPGTGVWTVIAGTATVTNPSQFNSGVTGLSSGVNTFRWTVSQASCASTQDDVNITNNTTTANAGPPQEVCATSTNLAANAVNGTWTVVSGTGSFANDHDSATLVTGLSVGANTFRWTVTNGSCTSFSDVTITRDEAPTANAGPAQEVCATTATLAGNTPPAGMTGAWTVLSGGGTVTTPSSPTSGVTGLTVGANKFKWTVSNGVCTPATSEVTITRDAPPTTANAGPAQEVCTTQVFLAGNAPTVGSGTWTVISGTGHIANDHDEATLVTNLSVGANTFRWTIHNGTCPDSYSEVTITRNATDDGNACTTDTCNPDGSVTHTPVDINDHDACTTDACDPATGTITHTPLAAINDNNACTTDACDPATGTITHTPLAAINDNNACTTDACDPATGNITHTPVTPTSDNNACTTDTCDPATGNTIHTPVNVNDNNACTTDACDPATGTITHTPLAAINDNNACTTDACDPATGNITHTPVTPTSDNNACTTDTCDPATGNTIHTPVNVNDNNACTTDACDPATGNVTHTPVSVDDGNACTTDACDPATGNITHTPVVPTSDNNACTTDTCDPATGNTIHTPVNTSDGNACTTDACDPATGNITHTPVSVDDGNACTVDACDPATGNITHTAVTPTSDNNACTVDTCDPATGNTIHTPVTPTSDNNACTTDTCDPATGNTIHTPVNTSDGNACTTDYCDPATGNITHTPVSVDDGNACTTDACDPATGNISHTPVTPTSDNNACTVDSCDPATGNTIHTPVNTSDGNACTVDYCDPATGNITHTPVSVDDGNACTTDACDPATGAITHTAVTPTSDGNACTTDTCDPATGNTIHTPVNINDNNACTTDACDPATGNITHTPVTPTSDGNACTTDTCDPATGNTVHTPVNVNDGNACTVDSCDPATGNISHTPVNVSDNNACTTDSCDPATGIVTHTAVPVDDGDACTTDSCDPATGTITHTGNTPPVVTSTSGPNPLALSGNSATVTANFTDVNTTQTHTCSIAWDDTTTSAGTVSESGGSGTCTGTHHYAATGVYSVTFTITDSCGGTATSNPQYVVIYDGGAGFVTGGGWINSPAGAYPANPTLTGKANFGFVSKYKAGMSVPSGETEFNFNVADFRFHSEVYEWMVISGAKARYRGTGSINGSGSYGFELTAWDGNVSGGGGVDRFRIKIWDNNQGNAVVYDNQMGAPDGDTPTTALGGGSIVLHK